MGRLIILTGAGLSAESGIRTFRDSNGLWENYSIDVVCHGSTWRANYPLVQKFYNDRRTQLATVKPNAAHEAIAQWQKKYSTVILTQNVDDLLERAGCSDVVHLHGFLPEMRCAACGEIRDIRYRAWEPGEACATCKSTTDPRPNIVFFGEMAPKYEVMWSTLMSLTNKDVLLVIGTSGLVLPVEDMARQYSGVKILNNLARESAINDQVFDHVFYEPATRAVPAIDAVVAKYLGA